MLTLINPIPRAEPFDKSNWLFEPKFDGFRFIGLPLREISQATKGVSRSLKFEESGASYE